MELGGFLFYNIMKKLTTQEFIEKAQKIHGDRYDYSESIYINSHTNISITCPNHGIFIQKPMTHLKGSGCKKCANLILKHKKSFTVEQFQERANIMHNYKYDYSKVNYENAFSKIIIICPIHGEFQQLAHNHLQGKACSKCVGKNKHTTLEFINKCKSIYGNKYDYSKIKYENANTKIILNCVKHGNFKKLPREFLKGQGCPKCISRVSSPEKEVRNFIKKLNIEILYSDRNILSGKELDIYIPSLQKAIEFNGLFWHYSDKYFVSGKHANKSNLCREKGIILLHIREELWIKDKEKMKQVITKFLTKH